MTETYAIARDPKASRVHIIQPRSSPPRYSPTIHYKCGGNSMRAVSVESPDIPGFTRCPRCWGEKPPPADPKEVLRGRIEWFTGERYTWHVMRRWLRANPGFFKAS